MDAGNLIAHVASHAGVSVDAARRATITVLSGVGSYLDTAQRELVAGELPPELGTALVDVNDRALPLLERVLVPGMSVGTARELIASVCRVLVESLSREAVLVLRKIPPITTYLAEPGAEAPHPHPHDGRLATGHPGSSKPISSTSTVQSDSVATPNPHAATKLSSSMGPTQERRHETLAEGAPRIRSLTDQRR